MKIPRDKLAEAVAILCFLRHIKQFTPQTKMEVVIDVLARKFPQYHNIVTFLQLTTRAASMMVWNRRGIWLSAQ
jgi:hypothetical protein